MSVFLVTLFILVPRVVMNQVFPTPGIKAPVRPPCVVFYVTPARNNGADVVYLWRGGDALGMVDSLQNVHGLRSTSASSVVSELVTVRMSSEEKFVYFVRGS